MNTPSTSVRISHSSACSAAASATAVVSEPPRAQGSELAALGCDALKPSNHRNTAVLDAFPDPAGVDVDDTRVTVHSIGGDARVAALNERADTPISWQCHGKRAAEACSPVLTEQEIQFT
ncbi:hypothetical protein, partial [Kibdelosporangium philippinense]|uniref:hypothetical protein n=1 Tax=Kibdelosporangium philippinense TaxID=211113 RepID=UPI00360F0003